MYVAACVPTIDEAATIGELVRALDKVCDKIVVVDESSDAQTMDAAEGALAIHLVTGGLGRAYHVGGRQIPSGWHAAHIDAGGSHDPQDLYPMLDLAEEGFDVVIGSRFCPGGRHLGPWHRRFTSRLASGALNLISLGDISDWTSGYRVYSPRARAILAAHDFTTTGHAWQIESLAVLLRQGCRIVETPIIYRPSVSHLNRERVVEAGRLYWRLIWA